METIQKFRYAVVLCCIIPFLSISQPKWAAQISGTSQNLFSVSFFGASTGIAVGDHGVILKTSNGGISWVAVGGISTKPINDVEALTVDHALIADGFYCLDAACGFLYKTDNRGVNWNKKNGLGNAPAIDFANELEGIVVGGGWNFAGQPFMGVLRTHDGGETWQHHSDVSLQTIFKDVAIIDSTFVRAVSGVQSEGAILSMVDDGDTWVAQFDTVGIALNSIAFTDALNGIVVGDNGFITKSSDGGTTWNAQVSNTNADLRSVCYLSPLDVYAAGDAGTILRSTDGGVTWAQEASGTTANLNKIYFTDADHGWAVGTNGVILKYGSFTACSIPVSEYDFGEVNETFSETGYITVKNIGTLPLVISSIVSDNIEFTVSPDHITLQPDETQAITVQFAPSSAGAKSGQITVTHNGVTSPEILAVQGIGVEYGTTEILMAEQWNLVSNPRIVENNTAAFLFPSAITSPYRYIPGVGYEAAPTILPGEGYWVKFSVSQNVNIAGRGNRSDTIYVKAGWNLIGTISTSVQVGAIIQHPPANIDSDVYSYGKGYLRVTTLTPGKGYWIRVKQDGMLILSAE